MKKILYICFAMLFAACSTNPWGDDDDWGGGGGGDISGGGSSSGIMDLGTLSTFDVAADTTNLTETENIPASETDDYWAQYVENNFTAQNTTTISFSNSTANVSGIVDGDTITANGGDVIVKAHSKGLVLKVSGTTSDGSVKVYSDKKWELLLTAASITNPDGAAINIQDGKCFVVVNGRNTLSDSSSATFTSSDSEDEKAVFFSEDDLRFSGSGTLIVNANNTAGKNAITSDNDIFIRPGLHLTANCSSSAGNGIKTKGDITMMGGVVNVITAAAGSKALKAEADIEVKGGRLTAITSGGVDTSDSSDPSGCAALKADSTVAISGGTLYLKSSGQGGKGISSDVAVNISGGTTWILTKGSKYGSSSSNPGGGGGFPGGWGGGSTSSGSVSPKGIRADGNITISGGELNIRTEGSNGEGIESKATLAISGGTTAVSAYDDGMNAGTAVSISGGKTFVISTGQCDGVDSNGSLSCSGGLLIGVSSTLGSEDGLDCESSMTCTGGTMVGFSNGGMTQKGTSSGRSFTATISGNAGTYIALCQDKSPINVFALPRTYSNGRLIYVTGELSSGTYSLVTGTTPTGGTLWMNRYEGATSISGGSTSSVTLK